MTTTSPILESTVMADEYDPIEKNLEAVGAGRGRKKSQQVPVYQMVGDSKIPVSKAVGAMWCARKDQGMRCRGPSEDAWNEAIRYYDNDQLIHRNSAEERAGNRPGARLSGEWRETENVVFSNCSIMVPMLYAKNPTITITTDVDANLERAAGLERLINTLLAKKSLPGLNAKPKLRRTVLTTLLTNAGFLKIGFTEKVDGNEAAIAELQQLGKELESAKDKKKVLEIEGKLQALEEKVSMLNPAGPFMKNMLPNRIVVDPTSTEPDASDAQWMMEWDYLPTSYINAVYGEKHGEETRSVYYPTHILDAGRGSTTDIEEQVNTFSLFSSAEDTNAATYGYDSPEAFEKAKHTKVWYIWDKATHRVLMYADNCWKWPLWVWDDPLKLPRFFPYFRLWFHESTNSHAPKGEVTYYLDQQDAINEIADEVRRGRQWCRRNVLFNKNAIDQHDVEKVLKGDDGTARGVDLPEGTKLADHIFSFVPPGLNVPEFFSPDTKFQAINRITGINEAQRGAQFKTNTTNKAVETYNKNTDIRVEERVDLIEDFVADVSWNICLLCATLWDSEDVVPFIGAELAKSWQKVSSPREFEKEFVVRVESGSSAKPNSREKKQQALELGQVLGQFASASPAVVILMMKMFERAFDEFTVADEDWARVDETMMQSLQKAGSGPGGEAGQGGPPGQQPGAGGPPVTDEAMLLQLKQKIAKLPPAAQQKLQEMVQAGIPPSEALQQVEGQLSGLQPS